MFSSRVPRRLLPVANSRRSMTRRTQRGSGTGNSTAFPKNKTQEGRVYKSTADLSPPEEKTPQWAKALESIMKSERLSLDSKMQSLESIMKSQRESLESKMQSLDSKMLVLTALMVGLTAVGFTATSQMIAGQNAKIEGQNAMIWGRNFMIGGQNAKIDGQNAKIEAATTCKGLDLMQGERGTVASPTAPLSTKMSHAAATICDQGGGVEDHGMLRSCDRLWRCDRSRACDVGDRAT